MPDLDELTGFGPGLGAPMLPPSEIRRRGDRLRRRRAGLVAAGGVLAVAVAIGTPVVALSGSDRDAPPPPPLTQPVNTARPVNWLQEIPSTFDVGVLPDDATFTFTTYDESAVDDFNLCGARIFSTSSVKPAPVDTAGATTGAPGTENTAGRTVALYRDDAEAHAALQKLRDGVENCPTDANGPGATLVNRIEESPLPADESFVYSQRAQMDVDLLSDLTVIQVARIGNALYIGIEAGGPGDEQSVAQAVRRLATLSAPVLSAMDATFSAAAVS